MNNRPIVIVFDDLFPGGLLQLNTRLWSNYKKNYSGSITVIAGIGFDQHLYNDTFSFADEQRTYILPQTNQVYLFFLVFFHTVMLLGKTPPDAIIIANNAFSGLAARVVSWVTHKKFFYFYHGSLYKEMESLRPRADTLLFSIKRTCMSLFYWTIQSITISTSHVICFSAYSRSLLSKHFTKRHSVQHLSIPFVYTPATRKQKQKAKKILGFHINTKLILFPSRIEPRKGLHLLIHALSLLPKEHITLVVTGPLHGESVDYLTRLTRYPNDDIHAHVYLTGEVKPTEMQQYYKAADVTVVPSIELETFGLVSLESLSSGTPVVGFAVGATAFVLSAIHQKLLSQKITSQSLAHAIQRCLHFSLRDRTIIQKNSEMYVLSNHSPGISRTQLDKILR